MVLQVHGDEQGNFVQIDEQLRATAAGSIRIEGTGNTIVIGPGGSLRAASIHLGGNCRINIGRGCHLADIEVFAAAGCALEIGDSTAFTCRSRILMHEPSTVSIGSRCLIASETILMTSDMHSIFDGGSGERINPAKAITIGDDVWLGGEVAVLKGASIGAGCAIGFRSVVAGMIPPGCIAVGTPARVVRERIVWRHELTAQMAAPDFARAA